MSREKWYKDGIRFECTGCGDCCRCKPGEEGYVYLSADDIAAMSSYLKMDEEAFREKYTVRKGQNIIIKDFDKDCLFLVSGKCKVYPVRPPQCKTWPFWEICLVPKAWKEKVIGECKGVGRGKLYSKEEIDYISQELSNL